MLCARSRSCQKPAHVDFIGPRRPASQLGAVRDAASHDRRPSAMIALGKDVLLLNGKRLDTMSPRGLRPGDCVRLSGMGMGKVLAVDPGKDEMSIYVARSLDAAERALAQGDKEKAYNAYRHAITYGQDASEHLLIAAHAARLKQTSAMGEAYTRAIDLAQDARETLKVAEHAADHQDPEDAEFAYGNAIQRTSDRKLLLQIAASAEAHGFPDQAKAAREKANAR